VFRIRGFGKSAESDRHLIDLLKLKVNTPGAAWQISAFRDCPRGMSGLKTIAYELAEQLPGGCDRVFVCAGSGGLVIGVARGFDDLCASGKLARRPSLECVQPEGNATIADPLRRGAGRAEEVSCTTAISGLQVPGIIDGNEAYASIVASGGTGHIVTDEQAWEAQRRLAREEGIFCEPAGAVPLAGCLQALAEQSVRRDETVVCLVTGSGFKDRKALDRMTDGGACPIVEVESLARSHN
jgi:threonine synthase